MAPLPATTLTTRFAPRQPATGTCRWLEGEGSLDPVTGNSYLQVEVTRADGSKVVHDYEVERLRNGFALHRLDPDTFALVTYRVTIHGVNNWSCDCPDAQHGRRWTCKHVRALIAALAKQPL